MIARPLPGGPDDSAPERFDALQAGRAVAAILVVLYHADGFVLPLRLYDGATAWAGFGWGYAGVEFFFVLSGFIIAHVHRRDIGRPARIGRFLRRRIVRIYPIYWAILAVLLIGYALMPAGTPEAARAPASVLASLLLVPTEARPILPIAWTLEHEMAFYLAFVALLVGARIGAALFGLWMGACALALFHPATSFPASFLLSPYNLLFAFGVAVAIAHPRLPRRAAAPLLAAGIAGFLAVGFSEQYLASWPLGLRTLAYGISAAAVIAALARARYGAPRFAVFLGDASYAIYLVHLPAMNLAAIALAPLGIADLLPPLAAMAALSVFAMLAGVATHLAVERPLLSHFGRPRRAALA
ncbi:acyltransferase family protein [Wenxinia saemankumensis]|uniref:Peptidoglycan/LPS O-acetylase OafA/YrhL, contains acyltransferase and SGNH-hydrolase domains n=1 Tax=Wenxinia saemankumensis TaxID=1447782 RepID=A0A1M6HYS1_9RHOB|nr:acyltransferase [Wenxinia saemankumensis]SHJ27301.1 Peptidoglycan/LPS O-acetylase OafA/YrhL, contains acyltransferase and SGNH-hydrolase domains [Wenxinia saemankumensis]